jgi:hypothetical protein
MTTIPESTNELNSTTATAIDLNLMYLPDDHRKDLSIYEYRDQIIEQIQNSPIVIVTGPTGENSSVFHETLANSDDLQAVERPPRFPSTSTIAGKLKRKTKIHLQPPTATFS